jgi:hypothetical protein
VTSSHKVLIAAVVAGVVLPPLVALLFVAIVVRAAIDGNSLLSPLFVANALPFFALYALGRSDLDDVERGRLRSRAVTIRLAGAWLSMVILSIVINTTLVRSGLKPSAGSSTDAVAVFFSPIYLFVTGLILYVLLSVCTGIYESFLRSRSAMRSSDD